MMGGEGGVEEDGVPQQPADPGIHIIDCLGRTYPAPCTLTILLILPITLGSQHGLIPSADEEVKV